MAALAQTTQALQDTTCVGNRSGSLTCTAGEFTVTPQFTAAPGTPKVCSAGSSFTADVSVVISGSNTNRYDIGFFVGQEGNDPRAATSGNICSASVVNPLLFPTGTTPWRNFDADTCGDLKETTAPPAEDVVTWTVQGVKVLCQGDAATGNLQLPFVLSYSQNSTTNASCSAANVTNGSPSKCNSGTAQLAVNAEPVQVAGYVELSKQTLPQGSGQSFGFTATAPAGISLFTSTDGGVTMVPAGGNSVSVNLADDQTVRIYMPITATARSLSIVEQSAGQPNNWQSTTSIVCSDVAGGGSPSETINNAGRTVSASLSMANSATACTFTNTQRPRITVSKSVVSRVNALDQFRVGASSSSPLYADNSQTVISAPSATTTGTATSASTVFRSSPGQSVTISDAMMPGSVSAITNYSAMLTCTNAYLGAGATPASALPSAQALTSYTFTPAPGDDISCVFTNTASNSLPVAVDNAVTVAEDSGPTLIPVLGNDSDPDGDTLTVTSVTQPSNGTVTFTATGLSYTPQPGYNGTDSFTTTQ